MISDRYDEKVREEQERDAIAIARNSHGQCASCGMEDVCEAEDAYPDGERRCDSCHAEECDAQWEGGPGGGPTCGNESCAERCREGMAEGAASVWECGV